MKAHLLLHQLFNQPHMVLPEMLHEAVAWASRRIGVQLHQVNVSIGAALPQTMEQETEGASANMAAIDDQRLATAQQTGVLVIPVSGVLVPRAANVQLCADQTSYESIRSQIQVGLNDPRVAEMVLELDSPGGAVVGCFELADFIRAAAKQKPIHAIVYYKAFSAAYAIACACTDISLSDSAGVGSIGVILKHADFSQQLAQDGVTVTTFYRGARKNDLAPDAPLSEDASSVVNERMDAYYARFTQLVSDCRGLSLEQVTATEAGLYFGQDAVAAGLADRLEEQQAAVDRIAASISAARATPARNRSVKAIATAMAMQSSL